MKNLFIQHEIILVTGASYYQRQLMGINDTPGDSILTQAEKLEKACWNGLINDLLSCVMERDAFQEPLTVRKTRTGREILKIELGSNEVILEKSNSIDSILFLETVSEN